MTTEQPLLTEQLHEVLDVMGLVLDAVDGYRRLCEQHGFSPTAAEHMAMVFHHRLVAHVFAGPRMSR